jgi:hypothetical protein
MHEGYHRPSRVAEWPSKATAAAPSATGSDTPTFKLTSSIGVHPRRFVLSEVVE